jgi:hypothetical protein
MKTPLSQLLAQLTPAQREKLAADCGTTLGYLRQLAGCHSKNPGVVLALKIEDASRALRARLGTRVVTVHDLASMCEVPDAAD